MRGIISNHPFEDNRRAGGQVEPDLLHELVVVRVMDKRGLVDGTRLNTALSAETDLVRVEQMPPLRRRGDENPVVRKRLRRIEVEGEEKIAADKGQHLVGFIRDKFNRFGMFGKFGAPLFRTFQTSQTY